MKHGYLDGYYIYTCLARLNGHVYSLERSGPNVFKCVHILDVDDNDPML